MNILITGNSGYIGSYLIDNFLEIEEWMHPLLDNIIVYDMKFENLNISHLTNIDAVIHLAGMTDAPGSFNNKEKIEEINIDKTKDFIMKCKETKVKKFIFPSTTSVYGISDEKIMYEDDDSVINPQSPYAEAKLTIEKFIISNLGEDTKYLIPRFGSVFGLSKTMKFHTAINKFCYSAATGNPLIIWKENYNQVRPYVDLETVFKFILSSLIKAITSEYWNNIYNVVSANMKLKDVISIIKRIEKNIELNFVKGPLINQHSYEVSIEKLEKTGFIITNRIEDSIEDIMNSLNFGE